MGRTGKHVSAVVETLPRVSSGQVFSVNQEYREILANICTTVCQYCHLPEGVGLLRSELAGNHRVERSKEVAQELWWGVARYCVIEPSHVLVWALFDIDGEVRGLKHFPLSMEEKRKLFAEDLGIRFWPSFSVPVEVPLRDDDWPKSTVTNGKQWLVLVTCF